MQTRVTFCQQSQLFLWLSAPCGREKMLCPEFFGEVRKKVYKAHSFCNCIKKNINKIKKKKNNTFLAYPACLEDNHTTVTNPGSLRANNNSRQFAPSSLCTCTENVTRIQSILCILLAKRCWMFFRFSEVLSVSYRLRSVSFFFFIFTLRETRRRCFPLSELYLKKVQSSLLS